MTEGPAALAAEISRQFQTEQIITNTWRAIAHEGFQYLDDACSILEYALHLRMYGENAPGGNETWREFDQRCETFLRNDHVRLQREEARRDRAVRDDGPDQGPVRSLSGT